MFPVINAPRRASQRRGFT